MTSAAVVTVNAAWNNGPNDASPTWSSIGTVERLEIGPRGRTYETDQVTPTRSKVRVDNVSATNHTTQTVNLVTNPGFEGGTPNGPANGWLGTNQSPGQGLVTSNLPYAGTYSLRLWSAALGDMSAYTTFAVSAGIDYAATCQVRSQITSRTVQLQFAWYNGTTLLSTSVAGSTTDATGVWAALSGTATAPANATRCALTVYVVGCAAGELHFVDAVCATVGTAIPTYFDGTSTNSFWANAANNSASIQQSPVAIDRKVQATAVYNSTTYYLFTGTTSQTPSTLDSGGFDYASTTYEVTDFQDALSTVKLRPPIVEETIASGASLYFPMGDIAGSTSVGDLVTGVTAKAVSSMASGAAGTSYGVVALGGSPFFPAADTTTNAAFSPHLTGGVPGAGVVYVIPSTTSGLISGNSWSFRCEFISSAATAGTVYAMFYQDGPQPVYIYLFNGTVQVSIAGTSYATTTTYNDGAPHVVEIRALGASGLTITVDGTQQYSTASATASVTQAAGYWAAIGGQLLGTAYPTYMQRLGANYFSGQIGHITIWNSGTFAANYAASDGYNAAQGYPGETVAARLSRTLTWVGFTGTRTLDTGNTPMGPQACAGKTAFQECQDVALSDDGIFFFKADGSARYRQGATRYTQVSTVVLGTAAMPIDSSVLTFDFDRQHLVNDLQATRPGGPTIRITDAASIARYQRRTLNNAVLTFQVNDDATLGARANRYLKQYGRPRVRCGSIALNPYSTPALFPFCLTVEPGDRITITNLPANAPAPTMDFIVESVAHPVVSEGANNTQAGWQTVLQLAPFLEMPAWIIGDSVYGVVGATNVVRG